METNIQVLKQTELLGQQFRVYGTPGEPLFRAKDIASIIKHNNITHLLSLVDDDEKGVTEFVTPGGKQQVWMLTESGLYEVLMQSRKPIAKQFKKGVKTILKEIRKSGGYMVASAEETPEEIMARALLLAQRTIEAAKKRADYEAARAEHLELQTTEQQKQLQAAAPKVQYYEDVLSSASLVTANQIALELGISAIRLNQILCEKQIQYRQSNTYLLFAKYRNKGYARSIPYTHTDKFGVQHTRQHLYWTEAGKKFILSLLKK